MDQYSPTGSISDRRGWEWNRTHGEASSQESDHPRTFAPSRYDPGREHESGSSHPEREVEKLREELQRRKQHREQIIRRYELCLAEKNRELTDERSTRGSDDLLRILLETLQR